ncbi:MAG: inositol monophosphatase [Clostridia bacterium]|nr:inositol monophosphatase [Clostridia bacterium]
MFSENIQEKLKEAMFHAGELVLSARYDDSPVHATQQLGIEVKPGSVNFVTAYDKAVQALLEDEFSQILPEARFLAEEDDDSGADNGIVNARDSLSGFVFVIDPIDGTTNFIKDYRLSTISAGLLKDGEPVWGAVLQPYSGEYFHAARGCGAFLGDKQIYASNVPLARSLIVFGTSPYYRQTLGRKSMAAAEELLMRATDLRRSGSAAYDLCTLAAGRADGFFELSLSPWDYAAGGLILKEAGGIVTNAFGEPLPFGRGISSSVVAGNSKNYPDILEIVGNIMTK